MKSFYRFIFILNLVFINVDCSLLCDGMKDALQKDRLATKTSYSNVNVNTSSWRQYENEASGCSTVKVWFISRHGTRFPLKEDYVKFAELPILSEEILFNHFQGRGCLSEEEVFEFKQWVPPYEQRDQEQLQEQGAEELFALGERWQTMFPDIFKQEYDSKNTLVRFTVSNRTIQSAYHFLRGMYGDDAIGGIEMPTPTTPDFVLRFHKACPLWLRDVYRNNNTYKEKFLFEETAVFQAVLHAVSDRLGYVNPLETSSIIAIYEECRYETAWFPDRNSIWCKPFSKVDIEVLEYHQDLKYYYEDGYGTQLNGEIACKTLSDLYGHLRSNVESVHNQPKGILYFSHDKVMLKVFTALNMFGTDQALKHDKYYSMKERAFRTSAIAHFAFNLGFVLHRCGTSFKVGVMFDGVPIMMPKICSQIVCPWENWESFLKPIYENCDISRICMIHDEL